MTDKTKFSAIILAAGSGQRFGGKKQLTKLNGKEIWKWSFDAFKNTVDEVIVIGIDYPGGKTRQESVKKGLEKSTGYYIIIHDAARPLISKQQIIELKDALLAGKKSVSFHSPVSDTIVDGGAYLNRKDLKAVLTPQGFTRETILKAHDLEKSNDAPDDCYLVQKHLGIEPFFIEGRANLFKITYPNDLKIVEGLLEDE